MEIQINTEKFKYMKCVYEGYITSDESLEMIVPDALPDIYEILETKAICCLKGKDSDNGSMSLDAQVTGGIIYLPENGASPQKIDITIPVTMTALNENIKNDSRLIASVGISSIETKIVNPRKVMVKAIVCAEVSCFDKFEIELSSGFEENTSLQMLKKECEITAYSDISEKLYVVSDEIKIGSDKRAVGDIISSDVSVITDEIKAIGSKVIINGILRCDILYTSPDESGIFGIKNENRFSQVVEMNRNCENSEFKIINAVTGVYLNSDLIAASAEKTINYEVHIVSQCISVEKCALSVLLDAYMPNYDLSVSLNTVNFNSVSLMDTISENIKASVPCNGISEVVSARGLISSITTEDLGSELSIYISGSVSVLYTNENRAVSSSSHSFRHKTTIEKAENEIISISAISDVSVSASVNSGSAECRITAKFSAEKTVKSVFDQITALSYDEEHPIDTSMYPSVVIHKPRKDDSIWSIIKKHHSSEELLLRMNEADNEETLLSKEYILIPKH